MSKYEAIKQLLKRDRLDLGALQSHADIIVNVINQIAHGSEQECVDFIRGYGGHSQFGQEFHRACRDIIKGPYADAVHEDQTLERPQVTSRLD